MPLLDHFHAPLKGVRHWESLHSGWANNIATDLNRLLPQDYFAEPHPRFGIEIDVAAFEQSVPQTGIHRLREVATASYQIEQAVTADEPSEWQAPAPNHSLAFDLTTETVEVLIYSSQAGPVLVGAVELISPANKDRPAQREAFVAKCETFLRNGIGLMIIDVVAERKANLHNELMTKLGAPITMQINANLYAVAYRSVQREQKTYLDIWQEALVIGRSLPTMPLWLQGELCLPVQLNQTYEQTCQQQRISYAEFT